MPATPMSPALAPQLALAMTVVATLTLGLAVLWWRRLPELRRAIEAVTALFVLAPVAGRTFLGAQSVAPGAANVVHESDTLGVVDLITRQWTWELPSRWLLGAGHGLTGHIAANRLLAILSAAVCVVLLRVMLRRWLPAVWLVALAGVNALALVVASSETWTPVIWLASCLGAVGLSTARHMTLPISIRWIGALQLTSIGVLLGPRLELAIVWFAAMLTAWLPLLVPEKTRNTAQNFMVRLCRRPARAPWLALLVVVSLTLLHGMFASRISPAITQHIQSFSGSYVPHIWVRAGLALLPTDISFIHLPRALSLTTSVALVALTLLGMWQIVVQRRGWLWLLISTLLVFKLYWAVGHGYRYEIQRYVANLLPAMLLFSALGWRWLQPQLTSALTQQRSRRGAVVVLLLLSVVDGRYGMESSPWSQWPAGVQLRRNHQVNANFLDATTRFWPTCVLVTRSSDRIDSASLVAEESLIVWGERWPARRIVGGTDVLAASLETLTPRPTCTLAVAGLSCALAGSVGCVDLGVGEPLRVEYQPNLPYRHPHFGVAQGVTLALTVRPLRRALRPLWLRQNMTIPPQIRLVVNE